MPTKETEEQTEMGYLGTDGRREQPTDGWIDCAGSRREGRENGWPRRCETVVMWRGRRLIKRGAAVALEWSGEGGRRGTRMDGRTVGGGGRGLAWRYACALLPVRPRLPMWGRRSPAHGNIKSNRRHPAPPHHLLPPRHRSPSGVTRTHAGGTVRFCVFPDQNA